MCQFLYGLPENLIVVKQKCGTSNGPRVSLGRSDTRSTSSWIKLQCWIALWRHFMGSEEKHRFRQSGVVAELQESVP